MNQKIIQVENVCKIYRRYKKQEGLVGLIGANGAGKTTLIKMLTGIIAPSSGKIQVLGYTPNDMKNEFKKKYVVVMGQKTSCIPRGTIFQFYSIRSRSGNAITRWRGSM